MQSNCPEATVWQEFGDGSIAAADRAVAESHLTGCRACRELLISFHDEMNERVAHESAPDDVKRRAIGLVVDRPQKPRVIDLFRPYMPLALAAMIIVAVGFSVMLIRSPNQPGGVSDLRQSRDTTHGLSLETPLPGTILNPGRLEFRWSDAGSGARYEYTLTDEKGEIIVQEKVAVNFLILDSAPRLSSHRKYYWSVVARFPDGTTRESSVAGFMLN